MEPPAGALQLLIDAGLPLRADLCLAWRACLDMQTDRLPTAG